MPKNELRKQLESVNSAFSRLLKLKTNLPEYAKIGVEYGRIVELACSNSVNASDQIKLIELAARLGAIQCTINSLVLSPTDESAIQDNDSQLELLENELDQLNKENTLFQKEKISLPKIKTFTLQLKKATDSWEKDKRNSQAAYYYNFACHILDTTTSPPLVKKSINYLEKSSTLYAQNGMQEAENETDIKIAKTREALMQLQLNHYRVSVDLTRIKTKKEEIADAQSNVTLVQEISHPPAVTNASDHPNPLLMAATEEEVQGPIVSTESALTSTIKNTFYDQITEEESAIPKNRSEILDISSSSNKLAKTSNKRSHPPLKINESDMPLKKVKISKTNSLEAIIAVLTKSNEELLNLEIKIFNEITASLERAAFLPDNYFYLQLINNVARFIQPHSNLDRLAQLRLSEIALYPFKLSANLEIFEDKQPILENEHSINFIYKEYFPLEERLKPEILQEKFQTEGGLKSLFLSEIQTYYFKQKTAKLDNQSRKNFLNDLQVIIEKSIHTAQVEISRIETSKITDNTLEIISYYINNSPTESEHQLLKNLLEVIQMFYKCPKPDEKNWLEAHNIPTSNPRNEYFLGKLNNLIGLYSAPGVQRIEFSPNGIPKLHFFRLQPIVLTKEIFLTRLKEHLLMLKTDYVASNKQYSAVCNRLTQLITTRIDQHAFNQRSEGGTLLPLRYLS